jgi:hypothetical protein
VMRLLVFRLSPLALELGRRVPCERKRRHHKHETDDPPQLRPRSSTKAYADVTGVTSLR